MRYHELVEDHASDARNTDAALFHKATIEGSALIKRDCQPYLSQVKDPMKLRRGVSRDMKADPSMGRPAFNKKSAHLTGRNPRGTQMKEHHDAVNDYFTSEFGFPFRNAVMTSGDQLQSSNFGVDVAVFPIGEFKFLWAPNVRDLNHEINSTWAVEIFGAHRFRDMERILIELISKAGYQTTDLEKAIESKVEIMIWVEEYYTLDNNVDRMLAKKLLK